MIADPQFSALSAKTKFLSLYPDNGFQLLLCNRPLGDKARTAFVGKVGVGPLEQHGKFVAEADEKNEENEQPGDPGKPSGAFEGTDPGRPMCTQQFMPFIA